MNMNYDSYVEMDNVTIEDCLELFRFFNKTSVLEDGRITNFVQEDNNYYAEVCKCTKFTA